MNIRPLANTQEAEECARLMSSTDPWITLGRGFEKSLSIITDPSREVYVAEDENGIAGFIVLCMSGVFVGYIQTVLVAPNRQGQGLGSQLVAFAEERIFKDSPNSFLCVSSFNTNARRLYERLGYRYVGELADYVVAGHSELLFRKTRGPWAEFKQ
ncbi:MAG TPA: GNAT family N-acetyltransferase [Gemmatimonadaceae bacterium]|nr:GNAT family N-acetyltransferase [Gemmatimonadaceae bacterium]